MSQFCVTICQRLGELYQPWRFSFSCELMPAILQSYKLAWCRIVAAGPKCMVCDVQLNVMISHYRVKKDLMRWCDLINAKVNVLCTFTDQSSLLDVTQYAMQGSSRLISYNMATCSQAFSETEVLQFFKIINKLLVNISSCVCHNCIISTL